MTVRKETNRKEKYHQKRGTPRARDESAEGTYGGGSEYDSSDSDSSSSSSDGAYHMKVIRFKKNPHTEG